MSITDTKSLPHEPQTFPTPATHVTPEGLDDGIVVEAGRRAPYTQVGDWVALSGISGQGKSLYWHLSMHLHVASGGSQVWPSRRMLAAALGLKKTSNVDTYVEELLELGAIDKRSRKAAHGGAATNLYLVHQTPPAGYSGPTDIGAWYDLHRPPSAKNGTTPSAKNGTGVVPKMGPKQEEVKQQEVEREEISSSLRSNSAVVEGEDAVGREREDSFEEDQGREPGSPNETRSGLVSSLPPSPLADDRAQRVADAIDWAHHNRPTDQQRTRLHGPIRQALVTGWSEARLLAHCNAATKAATTNPGTYILGALNPERLEAARRATPARPTPAADPPHTMSAIKHPGDPDIDYRARHSAVPASKLSAAALTALTTAKATVAATEQAWEAKRLTYGGHIPEGATT